MYRTRLSNVLVLRRASGAAALILGSLLSMCGCKRDADPFDPTMHFNSMSGGTNLTITAPPGGMGSASRGASVAMSGVVPNSSVMDVPAVGIAPMQPGRISKSVDMDYVDKADVYWKLTWIRKAIQSGVIPGNMGNAIKQTRAELNATSHDTSFNLADEAIDHFEQGYRHYMALQTLRAARVNVEILPFGGGADAIQRVIDAGYLGFGSKRSAAGSLAPLDNDEDKVSGGDIKPVAVDNLTPPQRTALQTILFYETKYHASPERLMRKEWREGMQQTTRLLLSLRNADSSRRHPGLMNPEAEKGVNMNEPAAVMISPLTGVSGISPTPPIAGTELGAQPSADSNPSLPSGFGKSPF